MDIGVPTMMSTRFFHRLIVSCATLMTVTCLAPGSHLETFANCLKRTRIDISYPSNETWWYDSQIVHTPVLRHPIAVAYAASKSDVQKLVRCAFTHGVSITPRSGGHSYEALSNEDDHLVIDISRITYVTINPVSYRGVPTATVGAGIRLGRLYYELAQRRMTFPAGSCPTVGLGGQVAAGGFGFLSRMWGMAADNVLEMLMVDYRGRVLVANRRTHPDLFFALRGGGGGSYGVVVRMVLRIYPFPKLTTAFIVRWNQPVSTSEFSRAFYEWAPWRTAPRELTIVYELSRRHQLLGMYVGDDGNVGLERILQASGILVLGPRDSQQYSYYSSANNLEARAWLDNGQVLYGDARDYRFYNVPTSFVLRRLDLPPFPNVVHETWAQIQTDPRVNATHPPGSFGTVPLITNMPPTLIDHDYMKYSTQNIIRELDGTAYDAIDEFLKGDSTRIQIFPSGGILYSIPEDFNAFAHRQNFFHTQYFSPYYLVGNGIRSGLRGQRRTVENVLIALEPYSDHRSYQGYVDLFWTTDPRIYMPRYYGSHSQRLVTVKQTYDVHNIFNNAQSTPTHL